MGRVRSNELRKLEASRRSPPPAPRRIFLRARFCKIIAAGAPRSLESFNTRTEIYKPTEKFDSKINNDIKSSGGGEI